MMALVETPAKAALAFDEGRCWLLLSEHAAIFQATSAPRIDSLGGFSMSHDQKRQRGPHLEPPPSKTISL
jgi:hypothetical protein